jgi:BirA family biotin operon repressor/biotin-[acetyl-CoA-carboxylase] ligase
MTVLPDLSRAAEAIAARGCELGRPLHLMSEATSTNDEAKRAARSGAPHGSTWVAESQTSGRGRQGRAWVSPRGENLLFSVLLRVDALPSRLPFVSLVAGLAVADAAERAGVLGVKIKWPNDVVVPRSSGAVPWAKLAGVLVETSMTGERIDAVVIGIGLNVHTRLFREDLAPFATSLALEGVSSLDRAEILADILAGLDRDVTPVLARGLGLIHARLAERDALLGRRVKSEAGEGVARGIDGEGRLVVERDGTREGWNSGEVHLIAPGTGHAGGQ